VHTANIATASVYRLALIEVLLITEAAVGCRIAPAMMIEP